MRNKSDPMWIYSAYSESGFDQIYFWHILTGLPTQNKDTNLIFNLITKMQGLVDEVLEVYEIALQDKFKASDHYTEAKGYVVYVVNLMLEMDVETLIELMKKESIATSEIFTTITKVPLPDELEDKFVVIRKFFNRDFDKLNSRIRNYQVPSTSVRVYNTKAGTFNTMNN